MVKLFYRTKRHDRAQRNRPTPVYTALLSILLCLVCLAGTSWAWFTASQSVSVLPIASAQYEVAVSITGQGYTEGQHEGNTLFYTLSPNARYSITLTPAEDNTATTGYCLISIDGRVYYTSPITAGTVFRFTCQTGVAVPEGLTQDAYAALVSQTEDTNLTVAWYWGSYPSTPGTDPGYTLLNHDAVLGTAPGEMPLEAGLILALTDFDLGEAGDVIPLCADYNLALLPKEDYELPETITVSIDETVYEVYTDGLEHREIPVDAEGNPDPQYLNAEGEPDLSLLPSMPTFDPTTNTLTIPEVLLTEDVRSVTITAASVATEPEVTEPEATEPEVTEPEVTEPETTEPELTEPEATEPEVTDPEVTKPEVTEPEVTEPAAPSEEDTAPAEA